MIKPILISNNNSSPSKVSVWKHCKTNQLSLWEGWFSMDKNWYGYDIILIDTETEIAEGDLYLVDDINIHICEKIVSKTIYSTKGLGINKNDNCHKIISSTNKSHNLPQLSPQPIKLLINYYNGHKCMPESVEIELEDVGTEDKYVFAIKEHTSTDGDGFYMGTKTQTQSTR